MRVLTVLELLATVLPLASSTPTYRQKVEELRFNPNENLLPHRKRPDPIDEDFNRPRVMSCGIRGKSRNSPKPADTQRDLWNLKQCSAMCKVSPDCKSWSSGPKGCDIYNATLVDNVEIDPKAQTYFYEVECPVSVITGALRLNMNTESGRFVGYVSKAFNHWGQRLVTNYAANALRVLIHIPTKADAVVARDVDIHQLNAIDYRDLDYFSPVVGWKSTNASLGWHLHNYAVIAASSNVTAGSNYTTHRVDNSFTRATEKKRSAQSAIWALDLGCLEIKPQWINEDGSKPDTFLVYVSQAGGVLAITGDPGLFDGTFEGSSTRVKMTLEMR